MQAFQTLPSGRNAAFAHIRQPAPCRLLGSQAALPRRRQCRRCKCRHAGQTARCSAAPSASTKFRQLYAQGPALEKGWLSVSGKHSIYYQVHGNPDGQAAVFVHGGPGAGCTEKHAGFFDPAHYRIVLLDQRGCGLSKPYACLEDNNTQALVHDLEKLRKHLKVSRWLMLGGSWGSTLAIAYAQAYPNRVLGLVLRGICLMRPLEIDWMYRGGAAALLPGNWHAGFLDFLPPAERQDPVASYYQRMTSSDPQIRQAAARAWSTWEMAVMFGRSDNLYAWNGAKWETLQQPRAQARLPRPAQPLQQAPAVAPQPHDAQQSQQLAASGAGSSVQPSSNERLAASLLTCHYSLHNAFLERQPLLQGIDIVRGIPAIGVQGALDIVTPLRTAYELHSAWPELQLAVVPNAGHSGYSDGIRHELLNATDAFRELPKAKRASPRRTGVLAQASLACTQLLQLWSASDWTV